LHELKENQRNALVAAAAEDLPDLYRTVLNLYYWMDCSIDEISAYISAPAGTIKSYLSRARERMRFELKKLGIEDI
jgi:RNA polymerase sigma-70 factor (ECF subfamily)